MSNENLENMRDSFEEGVVILHAFKQAVLSMADEYKIRSIQICEEEGQLFFVFCGIRFRLWVVPLRKRLGENALIRWAIVRMGETGVDKEIDTRDFMFKNEASQDGAIRYYEDPKDPNGMYCDNPPNSSYRNLKVLAEKVIDGMTEKYLA